MPAFSPARVPGGGRAASLWTKVLPLALLACLGFSCLGLGGCTFFGSDWESSKSSVRRTMLDTRDYINPSPQVDVTRYQWENPNREKLALLIAPVDAKVTELIKFASSTDRRPEKPWADSLMARFPWVDGLIVADQDGLILDRYPPVPLKRFTEPLVFESIWRETLVKTVVDYTSLGPELYFGSPNFAGTEFVGLHVVSFDPRSLFTFCPEPEKLVIVDPNAKRLWFAGAAPPPGTEGLVDLPWKSMMLEKSLGSVKVGEKQFTWLAKYIGHDQFVYATESANASIEDKGIKLIPFFGTSS